MSKREFIKDLTPGTLFVMDGANGTVYECVRVISMSPYTTVTYILAGDTQPREWQFTKVGMTTVTVV